MNIAELCEKSAAQAAKSGFQGKERPFEETTDLIHTELAEATEEYRSHRLPHETYYEVTVKGGEVYRYSKEVTDSLRKKNENFVSAKPCGIPSELADVIIRIAHHCGANGLDLEKAMQTGRSKNGYVPKNLLKLIADCHAHVALAYMAHENSEGGKEEVLPVSDPLFYLASCVSTIMDFCEKENIPLSEAIVEKAEYNATRPHKHGGKKI